ncbi:heme biosynthesis protein HemY [Methylosinus sporium]|uniref:Heme biosynthesis protein HemY n=1 Tax=Methylosinus sporium TaxID=428 RepID=A0A549SWB8_METSR|nr:MULTISPECIES: heme biosynthesis HemY N-terminal domain-containing protein [Methylosinus]MBU3888473.1 heme biosynthesis protein HemY [Methylosinus sp. KRF6]TRL33867.1 heme biosynthesis protein HemY [Methylosinus sporium]
MILLLFFIAALAALSIGLHWLIEQPGSITLDWGGYHIETSLVVGAAALIATIAAIIIAWAIIVYFFQAPARLKQGSRAKRRERGFQALSRGIVAAGAGHLAEAKRAAREAVKNLDKEPLTYLLRAQVAQLEGDRVGAETAFHEMTQLSETRLLGLRGLHIEAKRRKDEEAAHHFADQAHQLTPLPWAGHALLEHHGAQANWEEARIAIEANLKAKAIDLPTAQRLRAVVETALALEKQAEHPSEALHLARQAVKRAPDLTPAVALIGRLLAHHGDSAKALKLLEKAYAEQPHPDIAEAFLEVAPSESNAERLARVKKFAAAASHSPEAGILVARAALAARDFASARKALAPLVAEGKTPTAQVCLLMAELEDAENGPSGPVREWLARGSRAPRDPAWIADGVISRRWAPASPVTGKLDAFVWATPPEPVRGPTEDARADIPAAFLTRPERLLEAKAEEEGATA